MLTARRPADMVGNRVAKGGHPVSCRTGRSVCRSVRGRIRWSAGAGGAGRCLVPHRTSLPAAGWLRPSLNLGGRWTSARSTASGGLALAFAAEDEQRAERALLIERLVDAGEAVIRGSGRVVPSR